MANADNWREVLKTLRDEIALHAHLLEMELKEDWSAMTTRLDHLEQKLERYVLESAEHLGQAEAKFFVGNEDEIRLLVDELRSLKDRRDNQSGE